MSDEDLSPLTQSPYTAVSTIKEQIYNNYATSEYFVTEQPEMVSKRKSKFKRRVPFRSQVEASYSQNTKTKSEERKPIKLDPLPH